MLLASVLIVESVEHTERIGREPDRVPVDRRWFFPRHIEGRFEKFRHRILLAGFSFEAGEKSELDHFGSPNTMRRSKSNARNTASCNGGFEPVLGAPSLISIAP